MCDVKSEKKTDKKRAKRSTKIRTKNRTKYRTKNKRNDRTKKMGRENRTLHCRLGIRIYLRVLKVSNTYVSVPKSQNSNGEEKNYVSNHGDFNILTRGDKNSIFTARDEDMIF